MVDLMTSAGYAAIVAGQLLPTVAIYAQMDPTLPMSRFTEGTLIGQMVLLLTTLAGFGYTIYRENRNRRWDLEDRERAKHELEEKVELTRQELAEKVEITRQALADKVELARRAQQAHLEVTGSEIVQKIDENTSMNLDALNAANAHNSKIAELSRMFTEVRQEVRGATTAAVEKTEEQAETLHRVDENTQETVERLRKVP